MSHSQELWNENQQIAVHMLHYNNLWSRQHQNQKIQKSGIDNTMISFFFFILNPFKQWIKVL